MRLRGKVALITGAGSGIGRTTAQLFAREGAKVVVADLDREAAAATVHAISLESGEASYIGVDVTDGAQAALMVEAAVESYGRLDVLFNNAGVPMSATPVEDLPLELWDTIFSVNVRAIFLAVRAAVPIMKGQGGGVILITSSTMGLRPRPGYSAYAASKAAAAHLASALAVELGPHNIRVNALSPGATDTPMLKSFMGERDEQEGHAGYASRIPLGRLCQPADVANAALFLASDESAFLTGLDMRVDGGRGV
jgi:3-oxoacyl-[acyl-carrier protein] reductase